MPIASWPFELKMLNDTGVFEGIASTYGNVDQGGDKCIPGCFTKNLALHGAERSLLVDHRDVIGTVRLKDSPQGLLASGRLTLEVQKARETLALMKSGAIKGLSIGYQTIKDNFVNGVRELHELRVFEVSAVWAPMNEMATITAVKAREQDAEIRRALRDLRSGVLDAIQRKSSGTPVPGRFRF
jgi:HK97 family phage prohead protease